MPQQRETVTDRLDNVIQVIQLGRKTGQLSVERGEGNTYEEGFITFVNGQVAQATTGQRNGLDALNWLSGWGTCRFAFISEANTRTTGSLPSVSVPPVQSTHPSPQRSYISGRVDPQTGNLRLAPQTQPLPSIRQEPEPTSNTPPAPYTPPVLYRTRPVDEALRILEYRGLSRTHRHLLLLIDGQRTMAELVRLMGRDQDEVSQLLRDLINAAVIQQK
jgi:hypothetical protein